MVLNEELLEEWEDAYKAFVGAFDNAVARRRIDDEYARDARARMRAFNEKLHQHRKESHE